MSEAGKAILLREALANHMRSTRDRPMFSTILSDPRPPEDILSFFASYYLYNYSGIRLLTFDDNQDISIEARDDLAKEERRQLELEIRQLLGVKFMQELDVSRSASEFIIQFCDELGSGDPYDEVVLNRTRELIIEYLGKIPSDYSPALDVDFVNTITGWSDTWRVELYNKASGLKETAMSLRDELLKEHEHDVVETSILKRGLKHLFGRLQYSDGRLLSSDITEESWFEIANATARHLLLNPNEVNSIRRAHQIRVNVIDLLESDLETPTTIEDFEKRVGQLVIAELVHALNDDVSDAYLVLSYLFAIDQHEIKSNLSRNGIQSSNDLLIGLASLIEDPIQSSDAGSEIPTMSQDELDHIERSLKVIDKLEHTLEKPIKGLLRSKGLRTSELDKIDITLLTKDTSTLLGIEITVLEELKKQARVPDPPEVKCLLEIREKMKSGEYGSFQGSSGIDMSRKRQQEGSIAALRYDFAWHFMIGLFNSLTRVVEIYLRSKQDLLRIKALLKSIYEGTESELQHLREEILIDVTSMRIYELKCVFPELDASTICTWMHARFSSLDMNAARDDLESSPSPVFEGITDVSLKLDGLEFDNYAIAYDLMQRFLLQERKKKIAKEEFMLESQREEQKLAARRKDQIDVLSWIDTKAHTVFRAIGRVSSKGIEWSKNDDIKCSNLLAFYIKMKRGQQICSVCGDSVEAGKCERHGKGHTIDADDMDNLAAFLMRAITSIKIGLIGKTAEPMTWDESRTIVQREINSLKRKGKITSKTNLKELLPGEINQIIGPVIAAVVGKYFNDSLEYASRRVGFA